MEKGKWLDDFLKRPPGGGEGEESETMSRIAVTGQFSSAVSFSVFFSLSPYYLMAKAALPFLLAAEERKKGEMISSNPTAVREGGREEKKRRNGMI